jgi:hypothetical protein
MKINFHLQLHIFFYENYNKKLLTLGKIKVFKNANHLFQQAKTGQVQEYGSLPSKFVDGFTSVITQWIKK